LDVPERPQMAPRPDSKCIVSFELAPCENHAQAAYPSDTPHPGTQLPGIRVQLKAVVTLS